MKTIDKSNYSLTSILRPQSEFPLLERYIDRFGITEEVLPFVVFAYGNFIYCNGELDVPLLIHEKTHLAQQTKYGLSTWVEDYLNDPEFRLHMEVEAYTNQLKAVSDRNERFKLQVQCAKDLSSSLYGDIIDYKEAFKLLCI